MVVKHSFYEMCDYFEFLDELRSSGTTNMFGAASELAKEHSLQIADARDVLSYWMKTKLRRKSVQSPAIWQYRAFLMYREPEELAVERGSQSVVGDDEEIKF